MSGDEREDLLARLRREHPGIEWRIDEWRDGHLISARGPNDRGEGVAHVRELDGEDPLVVAARMVSTLRRLRPIGGKAR